ncbi:Phosphoribosylanthranilate isomerase [Halalkaliarchaeum sp. AArc-CO]|uniref:phosphoribosylanthranilate isomerase n=1 Tax=unclassified Halalkaliarchaeum TaxID=2678344 RepID=UPI00217D4F75|nr:MULTISPECIES: phosphoribosylanthranilate isomerase [unclassified Halalkaliarchaeum]MDR5672397.1 phosphoribosylanthranilate isomerase [Halalkaliarchaeum sp. AArc-GB]UWG49973.1 Phosphoribosylanthranilate isomerase [Halalkaliarchaeum sp. AArc-CO]
MARVKICGITRSEDLRAAVEAGADAVGVIADVTVDTPREVDLAEAAELVAEAPPFVTTTLVTMPESPSDAVDAVRTVQPDVIQLHGEFDADELGYLRSETGRKLVVAVDSGEADRARELDSAVDALLVDSTTDEGAGGTGQTHDWEATRELARQLRSPVVLAGGLTPENVTEAVRIAEPYAVDVASGVELTGGVKDHTALATFVRNAERSPEVVQ